MIIFFLLPKYDCFKLLRIGDWKQKIFHVKSTNRAVANDLSAYSHVNRTRCLNVYYTTVALLRDIFVYEHLSFLNALEYITCANIYEVNKFKHQIAPVAFTKRSFWLRLHASLRRPRYVIPSFYRQIIITKCNNRRGHGEYYWRSSVYGATAAGGSPTRFVNKGKKRTFRTVFTVCVNCARDSGAIRLWRRIVRPSTVLWGGTVISRWRRLCDICDVVKEVLFRPFLFQAEQNTVVFGGDRKHSTQKCGVYTVVGYGVFNAIDAKACTDVCTSNIFSIGRL